MVLATQNPIEMEGTYPLPEAQLDRFMLKLNASYPDAAELSRIIDRTTGEHMPEVTPVLDATELLAMRALVRNVVIASHVKDYAVRLVLATRPQNADSGSPVQRYVRHGASPRGVLSLILVAKAFALFEGRLNVSFDDLKAAALPALGHRILLNFEGEAGGINVAELVAEIVTELPMAGA